MRISDAKAQMAYYRERGLDIVKRGDELIVVNPAAIRTHKQLIQQALSEGKPVPPEVLADYPSLQSTSNPGNPGDTIEHSMDAWLLLHSVSHVEKKHSPGIVVDADVAARTPCTAYGPIWFSKGIVGALDAAQKEAYCPTVEHNESSGIKIRLENWMAAMKMCKEEIKDIPKGEKLEPWLSCLSQELRKRGIET